MRLEEMQIPRIHLDDLRDRVRIERIAPLRDGARFRMLAPSRVCVYHDGEWFDDDVIFEKGENSRTDKEKSGKKK
jgi:hypothetical protein